MKFIIALLCLFSLPLAAQEIGSVAAGKYGLDSIHVLAVDDPDMPNITCYITYYDRSMTFSDSSEASVSCVKMGAGSVVTRPANITSMSKNIGWRSTNLSRVFDSRRNNFVYILYTTGGSNAQHSISVVRAN